FHNTATNKTYLEGLLNECFKRIENTNDEDYFQLKDYTYKVDITSCSANLNIDSNVKFFGSYDFASTFKLILDAKNKGNLFWLMRRADSENISWLTKQVDT
ncbi:MAG: hypothetical protein LUD24_03805, partial [Phascolarctobacterium sp.]|nr:hypothetical protein [Phascolarctobacterium sp.]